MAKHYAIKCPNCAAPLDILGGGRVSTVTCSYCNSVIDLNNHYKVLAKFNTRKRPNAPFEIGMKGEIKGVEWTIIGVVVYKTEETPFEEWSEFFLYSPTHGYAWLVYENYRLYFSKRVRDFDLISWQERKSGSVFYRGGHYIKSEPLYSVQIEYVEGALTWVAKQGDRIYVWDYKGAGNRTLSIEKSGDELEVYLTEALDKNDIYKAFNLNYSQKSYNANSALGFEQEEPQEGKKSGSKAVKWGFLALFAIILYMNMISFTTPKTVFNSKIASKEYNGTFTVNSSAFMTSIELSGLKLGQSSVEFNLYKDKKRVLTISKNRLIYIKKELFNYWYYRSVKVILYLKLDKGRYSFSIKNNDLKDLKVKIKQRVIRLKYLFPMLLLLTIALIVLGLEFLYSFRAKQVLYYGAVLTIVIGFFVSLNFLFYLFAFLIIIALHPEMDLNKEANEWSDDE